VDLLSLREKEIFETLKKLEGTEFVVVGGYSVNSYALPRFSIDCDIVIKEKNYLKKIELVLFEIGYQKMTDGNPSPYKGSFSRYEKTLQNNFKVSIDILIEKVTDRQSGDSFSAEWIFQNSENKELRGKTIFDKINVLIIKPDALFIMKFASCRMTDIRDLFMIIDKVEGFQKLKKRIREKEYFSKNFEKIRKLVSSEQFKNNLEGVYGYFDQKIFEKHKKRILELGI